LLSRLPVTLGVAGGIVLIDQVSKAWAVHSLEGAGEVPVVGDLLTLILVRNPGAAFSIAGSRTVVFSLLALAVSILIVRTARKMANIWWAIVLGGVLGGAVGNLLDRLFRAPGPFRGHVVDFLQIPNWPVFNVADMALVGAAGLALVLSIRGVEMAEVDPENALPASADREAPNG
jgi:signal peptidase II